MQQVNILHKNCSKCYTLKSILAILDRFVLICCVFIRGIRGILGLLWRVCVDAFWCGCETLHIK